MVSLKRSLALTAVLSVGRKDYHTAYLCLTAPLSLPLSLSLPRSLSISNKNTPMLQFCLRSQWKSYFNMCAQRRTYCRWSQTLTHWRYSKNTPLHHSLSCSIHLCLFCVSLQILLIAHTGRRVYTLTYSHTAEWIQRGRISLSKSRGI